MKPPDEQARDPVCGMTVDPSGAQRHRHAGTTHYFCSERCLSRFRSEPERFAGGAALQDRAVSATPDGRWTCPMHSEIVRDEPGSCPICGMALEPTAPAAEEQENPELAGMIRRFGGSLILVLPIFAIAMTEMLPGNPLSARFSSHTLAYVQLALGTPVVLWGGWPFFVRGLASLRSLHLNMFTLIAIGTGAAWLYSAFA